jgi:hypothetical protein
MKQKVHEINSVISRAERIEYNDRKLRLCFHLDSDILSLLKEWDDNEEIISNEFVIKGKAEYTSNLSDSLLGEEIIIDLEENKYIDFYEDRQHFYKLRWDDFLNNGKLKDKPFYLTNERLFVFTDQNKPSFLTNLVAITELKNFLCEISDYPIERKCIIFKNKKLEIIFNYQNELLETDIDLKKLRHSD